MRVALVARGAFLFPLLLGTHGEYPPCCCLQRLRRRLLVSIRPARPFRCGMGCFWPLGPRWACFWKGIVGFGVVGQLLVIPSWAHRDLAGWISSILLRSRKKEYSHLCFHFFSAGWHSVFFFSGYLCSQTALLHSLQLYLARQSTTLFRLRWSFCGTNSWPSLRVLISNARWSCGERTSDSSLKID